VPNIYINSGIAQIDDPLKEEFKPNIVEDYDKADILVLSKRTVKPGDISEISRDANKRIMLLLDEKDTDLINEAKAAGVRDLFYSPVKLPVLSGRIEEAIEQMQQHGSYQPAESPQKEQTTESTESNDELRALLNTIKSRMIPGNELQALRIENQKLKSELAKYENFVAMLKEIFN
jgi:hypothetical protein